LAASSGSGFPLLSLYLSTDNGTRIFVLVSLSSIYGMMWEGDHAAVLAQSASVKKTQPAFLMHRDLNAAWNLWNVLAAEYAGLVRPADLTQPPAA